MRRFTEVGRFIQNYYYYCSQNECDLITFYDLILFEGRMVHDKLNDCPYLVIFDMNFIEYYLTIFKYLITIFIFPENKYRCTLDG